MPPAKKIGVQAPSVPASSQQRSIATYFGRGPGASALKGETKAWDPSLTKDTSNSLSISASSRTSLDCKKPGTGTFSHDAGVNEKLEFKVPGSSEMNGVQTPSPSEEPSPSLSVTKCFGRRGRNSVKAAERSSSVVICHGDGSLAADPLISSDDASRLPVLETAKPGGSKGSFNAEDSVIGRRLRVWWPLDKVWYPGRIQAFDKVTGTHVIAYDDGEDEVVTLSKEKLEWLDENEAVAGLEKLAGNRFKRRGLSHAEESPVRKKIKQEETSEDITKQETFMHEDSWNVIPRSRKRSRSAAEQDGEVKATITEIDFDEVEIAVSKETEVKPLRRLKRKLAVSDPETKKEGLHLSDVHGVDVAAASAGISTSNSSVSDRRLGEQKALSVSPPACVEESMANLDEGDDQTLKLSTESSEIPSANRRTAKEFFDEKISWGRASKSFHERSQEKAKAQLDGEKGPALTQASSRFPAKQGLQKVLLGDSKGSLSCPGVELRKTTSEDEADKFSRGVLHDNLVGEAAARFEGRHEEKLKFLGRNRRDASGKRPSDPEYDSRTVLLPQEFLKGLSGGQRQWWEFKSKHLDKVLFFKMGKFYEMFEMDAHVVAQELNLQYMKGEQPHCGFPEKNYAAYAEILVQRGYRVLVIEQTETPKQLEQRKKMTGTKDKVVIREVCGLLTKGTIVDGDMLTSRPDAGYLLAITEKCAYSSGDLKSATSSVNPDGDCIIGLCFIDTSTSHILLGQFRDDASRSRLRRYLVEYRPVEILKPRGVLSAVSECALKEHTRQALVSVLTPGKEFWDAKRTLNEIRSTFSSLSKVEHLPTEEEVKENVLPKAIQRVVDADNIGESTLSALGGAIFYLRQALLDRTVLRSGRIDLLSGSDSFNTVELSSCKVAKGPSEDVGSEPYMVLDSAALENLELLENNKDGGSSGTLLGHLDSCATPYGRRLLRRWLVRPLVRVDSIRRRQKAICDLKNVAADSSASFRRILRSQPDLERLLSRLLATSDESGRNAVRVVLYEDAAKKLLQEFLAALRGCSALLEALKSFEVVRHRITADLLNELVTPDVALSELRSQLEHFETAFDWDEAEATGRIVPSVEGIDAGFDEANRSVKDVKEKLSAYLSQQRQLLGNCTEINYVTVGTESYQIEVPEALYGKVPQSYEMTSSRKGYQRYVTPDIKELLLELSAAEQRKESALKGIMRGVVDKFCGNYHKWLMLIKSVAELDVLISLLEAGEQNWPSCLPSIVDVGSNSPTPTPVISARSLRHPTLKLSASCAVVPNDISLGGGKTPFMLLTGPNMGGKSTYIRQVCFGVILAQMGAYVPADEFVLSPVDKIFVRMGARDHIMSGQSTFLVEMSETAAMLQGATVNSLVALDELGRGTSTSDGQAIAHAVIEYLVKDVGCRGMFATHYHKLSAQYITPNLQVCLAHMSCAVGAEASGSEEVTFLYKLAPGPCPKSYGVNVARLAGVPESVLLRAAAQSAELESAWAEKDRGENKERSGIPVTDVPSKQDFKLLNGVSELMYRILVEVDKNSGREELSSLQKLVHKAVKANEFQAD